MSTKPPSEQEIVELARERLAERQQREDAAKAARDAEAKEKARYVEAFRSLVEQVEAVINRLADQGVPISIQRTDENRAVLRFETGARILWAELLRAPTWVGRGPVETQAGLVTGAVYLGTTLNDRGVSDALVGCNFLWVLPKGGGPGGERWIACWARTSGLAQPQLIAQRHGLSVPATQGKPFGIPLEDILYEQLGSATTTHTLDFDFSDDVEGAFREVLRQALSL